MRDSTHVYWCGRRFGDLDCYGTLRGVRAIIRDSRLNSIPFHDIDPEIHFGDQDMLKNLIYVGVNADNYKKIDEWMFGGQKTTVQD
jgi:hypothetical protein